MLKLTTSVKKLNEAIKIYKDEHGEDSTKNKRLIFKLASGQYIAIPMNTPITEITEENIKRLSSA